MKNIYLFLVFIIYLKVQAQEVDYSLYVLDNVTFEDMENGFKEVPNEAKTKVFGFWNEGLIDKKTITRDLEEYCLVRIKGVKDLIRKMYFLLQYRNH